MLILLWENVSYQLSPQMKAAFAFESSGNPDNQG